MKRTERVEHGHPVITYTFDDREEAEAFFGFKLPDDGGMRRNPGARITVSGDGGAVDYENLVVYGPGDWIRPDPA